MAKALQRRRGTTEEHKSFTGLEGEFTYDTTEKRVVAHDGKTKGGVPMAKESEIDDVRSEIKAHTIGESLPIDSYVRVDLNTFSEAGIYFVNSQGQDGLNFPGDKTSGFLVVYKSRYSDSAERVIYQTFYEADTDWSSPDHAIFTRKVVFLDGANGLEANPMAWNQVLTGKGGTLKGVVNFINSANDGQVQFYGGTAYGYGGFFGLYGKDHASRPGQFYINAHDGTNNATLQGKPDGSLLWGGKNVVRSINGTTANASGDVTIVTPNAYVTQTYRSGVTWYRKWSDGFIEQGGQATNEAGKYAQVTYPQAMGTVLYVSITAIKNDKNYIQKQTVCDESVTSTGFQGAVTDFGQNKIAGTFCWYACGYV